ncbi:MAG TPA: ATP phosphoribosyltransferase [Candidatus Eisenbacteria bacterium]|jgi:ATP phosphoribosyltransferase
MLKIALPNKGRLADETRELFDDAGLDVRARGERALTASLGGEFEGLFVRAQDIPEFVADGAADAGVTGWDLVCESQRALDPLIDLEFGHCRLVLAGRDGAGVGSLDEIRGTPRVATVFPHVTREFFERRGRAVEIVPMSGSAEIAPHIGIADLIVDLTSTGSTLRVNGLVEMATLLESTARLVATPGLLGAGDPARPAPARDRPARDKARALEELVAALSSVLRARGKRYVMANVPRASLESIRSVLPGLNGPTVVDILDGNTMVAVHAVVESSAIYRTIADLKALGAQGILVTRIERLMP